MNRLEEVRSLNPELADAIDQFINSIASHQELIEIYTPTLSELLIKNMSLLKEAINAAWYKSIRLREETLEWAKNQRELNRKKGETT